MRANAKERAKKKKRFYTCSDVITSEINQFQWKACDRRSRVRWLNKRIKELKETEISHLYSHSLSDEKINLLISPRKAAYNEAFLNLNGTKILYCRSDITPGGVQWWVINTDGSDNQEILNFGPESKVEASWLPDSDGIVFITDTYNDIKLKNRLTGIYSVEKQTIKWINKLGESLGPELSSHDFSNAFVSRYDPSTLILSEEIKTRKQIYFFNLYNRTVKKFPEISGTVIPQQKLEGRTSKKSCRKTKYKGSKRLYPAELALCNAVSPCRAHWIGIGVLLFAV